MSAVLMENHVPSQVSRYKSVHRPSTHCLLGKSALLKEGPATPPHLYIANISPIIPPERLEVIFQGIYAPGKGEHQNFQGLCDMGSVIRLTETQKLKTSYAPVFRMKAYGGQMITSPSSGLADSGPRESSDPPCGYFLSPQVGTRVTQQTLSVPGPHRLGTET